MAPNSPTGPAGPNDRKLRGEVAYIYAFDLAHDMKREQIAQVLGQPTRVYSMVASKRSPKRLFFYEPQMVFLPPESRQTDRGTVQIHRGVKLYSIGALSIVVRVPFEVERIADLVGYHDLMFATGSLSDEVTQLAEQVRDEMLPYCVRPVTRMREGEAYTVFCIDSLPVEAEGTPLRTEDWLADNRRTVAGLLTQEEDAAHLSEQEAGESTGLYLSYYDSDLVVMDWDAALVIGGSESRDDILHITELANVQLVELATYDRQLDTSLEAAYPHIAGRMRIASPELRRSLREIRVDLARLSDELSNITKFFGDWYLANVYFALSKRFHLADWHRVIREKLRTLGDLYEVMQRDRTNLWMVILEATIVLLFIIDVVVLLLGL